MSEKTSKSNLDTFANIRKLVASSEKAQIGVVSLMANAEKTSFAEGMKIIETFDTHVEELMYEASQLFLSNDVLDPEDDSLEKRLNGEEDEDGEDEEG